MRPTTRQRRAFRAATSPITLTKPDGLRLTETHFWMSKSNIYRVHAGGQTWNVEYDSGLDAAYHSWLGFRGMPGTGIPITPAQLDELRGIFNVSLAAQERGAAENGGATPPPS